MWKIQITAQDKGERIYTLKEDVRAQILVLRYLTDGDYPEPSRSLFSYRDMPWGEVYYRQFYGRCVARLAKMYGRKQKQFTEIMKSHSFLEIFMNESRKEKEVSKSPG